LERFERLTALRGIRGLNTRFTTNDAGLAAAAVFVTSFIGDLAALGVSTTDFSLGSGFVINFLVVFMLVFDFDVNFFATSDLTATFALTFDFTVMTHILSWIIETPSASFLTDCWCMFQQLNPR
jgi:hypothetical protein